ncbi:hypothetical protein D0C36_19230 [Mucilaginibacter conchicola]|uniref:Uncharacterized protein n=1 Tax=Mucilaginibacter conchicola TaxID=2303333 RepID=A0A372NR44_9SPHI|nr:hypothetical protein [Mucilaginibacter conchicola]RFZ91077.1 hypothetical protein D0C36_19230 [Mucilaginibacter conchicola]
MWRKIHSNRDPRDTLFSELCREFKPRLSGLLAAAKKLIHKRPKVFFALMLMMLFLSVVLSFTAFRQHDQPVSVHYKHQPEVISDGFSRIAETAEKLNETIRLKRVVDSLTAKKQLSTADSLRLNSVLNRLEQIQKITK